MAYLSFPSLKDPHAQWHTAEIIAPLSYRSLEAHRDEPWRRRSEDYASAKSRITQALLDIVERHHRAFGDLVEYSELGTPLTFEHSTAGSIWIDLRLSEHARQVPETLAHAYTPIRNLCLTGSDVALLGIMGALMGGVPESPPAGTADYRLERRLAFHCVYQLGTFCA